MFDWTQYATELCRLAAPLELAGKPIYVLDADRESLPLPKGAAGFTGFHLSEVLREHLESTGRWQGAGFATVVSPRMQGGAEAQYVLEAGAIVCTIHELGHCIEHLAIDATVTAAGIGSLAEVVPHESYALYAGTVAASPVGAPWHQHGVPFIRSFLHLVSRLKRHGINLITEGRAAGPAYGLSPLSAYAEALDDEPDKYIDRSLIDALLTKPPAAMVQLFERDTKSYRARAAA